MVQLEASKLFSQLLPPDLAALRKIASERRFETGSEIFKEGDRGDGLYVVKDGLVEISGLLSSQVRHVFSRLGPGDIFGEMAVIDQKPRSACATAVQPTLLYFIACGDMQALVERSLLRDDLQYREDDGEQWWNDPQAGAAEPDCPTDQEQ